GVDVVVFGNHEFDLGPEVTQQRMAESAFAWLGTNVLGPDGKPFGGALATMMRQVGELTVGLFGLLTPETVQLSSPGPTVTVTPSWRMIANRGVSPDANVTPVVAQYTAALDQALGQPVGQTQTALSSQREEVRTRESTMGDLIADALREALQADIALINGGG